MLRVTIKALQEQIHQLKNINDYYTKEMTRLNKQIDDLKDKENVEPIKNKKKIDALR